MTIRTKLRVLAVIALLPLAALLFPTAAQPQGNPATVPARQVLSLASSPASEPKAVLVASVAAPDPAKAPGQIVPSHFEGVTVIHAPAPPERIPPPGTPRTPLVHHPVKLASGEVLQGATLDATWRVPVQATSSAR